MKLPNAESARLGDKIDRYCLNPNHNKGKNKANLFRSRLGITLRNKKILEAALMRAAIEEDAVIKLKDQYGIHYNVRFLMKTDVEESWVLGCWIVRVGEDFPRLTNAYPIRFLEVDRED